MAKKWSKMTKAQKCVAVAEDVIAQLKAKKYVAQSGTYITFNYESREELDLSSVSIKSLFKPIEVKAPTCQVCAKGAAVMSMCNLNGDRELTNIDSGDTFEADGDEVSDIMYKLFGAEQADLIEAAFEGNDYHFDDHIGDMSEEEVEAFSSSIAKFCERYASEESRLVGIMKNIIKNKGKFILPK